MEPVEVNILQMINDEDNTLDNTLLKRFADQDSTYKEKIKDLINEKREKLNAMVDDGKK